MKKSVLAFDSLLEHYLFSVARGTFELADRETQDKMIRLIHQVNVLDSPALPIACLSDPPDGQ